MLRGIETFSRLDDVFVSRIEILSEGVFLSDCT